MYSPGIAFSQHRYCSALAVILGVLLYAASSNKVFANPVVTIDTNHGNIRVELYPTQAPKTVENFLAYAKSHFYDGLIFHRVIDGFVIQTGGYWFDLSRKKPTRDPVVNESNNGLKNRRGTLAMARHEDPDSANAQFFINLRDNPHLDATPDQPGYTVFGRVIEDLDVADSIGKVRVNKVSDTLTNVPVTPVQINSITITEARNDRP